MENGLDPVREFLNSVYYSKLEYDRLSRRIAVLESRCEKMASHMSGVRISGSSEGNERLWPILADERNREAKKLSAVFKSIHEVEAFIDSLSGTLNKTVLKLRYLELLRWPDIQERLKNMNIFYSERQLTRLHGSAMKEARRAWEKQHAEQRL